MSSLSQPKPSSTLGIRRGVERPKPLKSTSVILPDKVMASSEFPNGSGISVDALAICFCLFYPNRIFITFLAYEVLSLYGFVVDSLTSGKPDPKISQAIVALNAGLKIYGSQLDQLYKDKLDRYQVSKKKKKV